MSPQKLETMNEHEEIRTLDMAKSTCGVKEIEEEFCKDLVDCLSGQGFVKLQRHSVPADIVKEAFLWNGRFFNLPEQLKQKVAHPPQANPNRGWSAIGQEKSSAITDFEKGAEPQKQVFDAKEAFDIGAPDDPLYANKWPSESEFPRFKEFGKLFYQICQQTHMNLLRAIERGFRGYGIDVDLVTRCKENVSELRFNYYPAINVQQLKSGEISRISPHTDFGTVTLLFQDSVGGLEVEDQANIGSGKYIAVEPHGKTEMLINIGDSLQRLTNNYLTSVSHKVTLPVTAKDKEEGQIKERYSIAYFAKVSRHQSLYPLAPFVDDKHPPQYPNITAYELNQMKLQKIYG